jgi:hypothetical protein
LGIARSGGNATALLPKALLKPSFGVAFSF